MCKHVFVRLDFNDCTVHPQLSLSLFRTSHTNGSSRIVHYRAVLRPLHIPSTSCCDAELYIRMRLAMISRRFTLPMAPIIYQCLSECISLRTRPLIGLRDGCTPTWPQIDKVSNGSIPWCTPKWSLVHKVSYGSVLQNGHQYIQGL